MTNITSIRNILLLSGLLALTTGCSSVDRMGSKLDMAADHQLDASQQPEYQGQLQVVAKIGDMTSLQFTDGQFYDVAHASLGLEPGDIVRIYKTDDGLIARLWQAPEDSTLTSNTTAVSPRSHKGS